MEETEKKRVGETERQISERKKPSFHVMNLERSMRHLDGEEKARETAMKLQAETLGANSVSFESPGTIGGGEMGGKGKKNAGSFAERQYIRKARGSCRDGTRVQIQGKRRK